MTEHHTEGWIRDDDTAAKRKQGGKTKQAKSKKGATPSDEDVRYVWAALSGGRPTVHWKAIQQLAEELGMHWNDNQCYQMIELFAANLHRSQVCVCVCVCVCMCACEKQPSVCHPSETASLLSSPH